MPGSSLSIGQQWTSSELLLCLITLNCTALQADTESREYLKQHSEEVKQCKECKNNDSSTDESPGTPDVPKKETTEVDNELSNLQIAD